MILQCSGIAKAFGDEAVLKDVSFILENREKAAVVGANGAGKTTLFRIIAGETPPDGGETAIARGARVGYLAQMSGMDPAASVEEEMLAVFSDVIRMEERIRELEHLISAGRDGAQKLMEEYARTTQDFEGRSGYEYKSRVRGVLRGLGFSEAEARQRTGSLSGGERTRAELGRLLLTEPDILLLDEPTNHLDIPAVSWLEDFLRNYRGAALIISHDRYFINRIVSKVIEIENGASAVFNGDYTAYSAARAAGREAALKAYMDQLAEIRRQQEVIAKLRSFNREKSVKRANSREKLLQKFLDDPNRAQKPPDEPDRIRIALKPARESGADVLSVNGLSKSFGGVELFEGVSFEVKKGDKIALIGPNGAGKTTLVKILMGLVKPDGGYFRLGAGVRVGYYEQEWAARSSAAADGKTVFDELADAFPRLGSLEIRGALAAFAFTGDAVFKPVRALSGGELGRVALVKIMLSGANFLILDEPTNHLDIFSKEVLEQAINRYTGAALIISHDRYFINSTARTVIELSKGGARVYRGDYDYYTEKVRERAQAGSQATPGSPRQPPAFMGEPNKAQIKQTKNPPPEKRGRSEWLTRREREAGQRRHKNLLQKTEDEIALLEAEIAGFDARLSDPATACDHLLAAEIFDKRTAAESALNELYERWGELV